jgi:CRISPR/Cas system CSM-associated protein Csm3 (group 7 of RAMP superfamily)
MTRAIHARLKIEGELVTETPLHVGGYGESFETDMALARNGRGEFYIPGTSLTGSLRSWFQTNFGKDETIRIWGFQETDKERIGTDKDRSKASHVLIEDLTLPAPVQSELRDGVGIDRVYGAAAEGAKFDRAVLPKGTKLNLEMTVELEEMERALRRCLDSFSRR